MEGIKIKLLFFKRGVSFVSIEVLTPLLILFFWFESKTFYPLDFKTDLPLFPEKEESETRTVADVGRDLLAQRRSLSFLNDREDGRNGYPDRQRDYVEGTSSTIGIVKYKNTVISKPGYSDVYVSPVFLPPYSRDSDVG